MDGRESYVEGLGISFYWEVDGKESYVVKREFLFCRNPRMIETQFCKLELRVNEKCMLILTKKLEKLILWELRDSNNLGFLQNKKGSSCK